MFRLFIFTYFFSCSFSAFAQRNDSLFVLQGDREWELKHSVKAGETVFSIAKKYHVPPAILSDRNNISYQQELQPKTKLYIPLGGYNLIGEGSMRTNEMKPIFFRVEEEENLRKIARNSNVAPKKIQEWNNLYDNDIYEGQILQVGWILYDATPSSIIVNDKKNIPTHTQPPLVSDNTRTKPYQKKDTVYIVDGERINDMAEDTLATISEAESIYLSQTNNGERTLKEKGPAVFFQSNNPSASFYYAFHNTASKGTIIKVENTGNGRYVFVKVLGPLPQTGMYHNSIIGISSKAKNELGIGADKTWCELTYAP